MNRSARGAWSDRTRARTRAIGASLATGLATAALPVVAGGAAVRPQLLLAGAAIVALVLALAGWAPGFTLAAVALGAEYALRLGNHHDLDGLVILEAVALFATVELGLRALEARSIARRDANVRRAATTRLLAMLAGAALAAFVVLAAGTRRLPAPTAALALGLAAAVALLVVAELLRRRATHAEIR
ncbi:MAG: hypothetical protein QOF28_1640 [Actinomycetota bacterium]|jgi:hypothetical protein|nr:hypothetical protein [Actinomycetota bacterium]